MVHAEYTISELRLDDERRIWVLPRALARFCLPSEQCLDSVLRQRAEILWHGLSLRNAVSTILLDIFYKTLT